MIPQMLAVNLGWAAGAHQKRSQVGPAAPKTALPNVQCPYLFIISKY